MVFNQLFENLPLCITNSYYPKKFDKLPGTQISFDIDIDIDIMCGTQKYISKK